MRDLLVFSEMVFEQKEVEELASGAVVQDEVKFFRGLESGVQADEEGVLYLGQDVFFCHDVLLLVILKDVFFVQDFQGVQLGVWLEAGKDDLGVGPSTNLRNQFKLSYRYGFHLL
jgi:hypothetical protein